MLFRGQLDPVASDHLCVCHEPNLEVDVGLEGGVRDVAEVLEVDLALFQQTFGRSNQLRQRQRDLDEGDHLVALQSKSFQV